MPRITGNGSAYRRPPHVGRPRHDLRNRSAPPVSCLPQRGERYRLIAPNTATAPRVARDFVGTLLRTTEHPGLVDDARLCVSEVVSNAHCHTRSARIRST